MNFPSKLEIRTKGVSLWLKKTQLDKDNPEEVDIDGGGSVFIAPAYVSSAQTIV
jgi:hypothetical protein